MTVHQDRTFEDLRSTVQEYARILQRHWRLGLLGLTIVSSIAFWISQYLPREYGTSTLFERRDDVVLRNLVRSSSPYSFGQLRTGLTLDMTGSRALALAAIKVGLLPDDAIQSEEALTNEELRLTDAALGKYKLRATVRLMQSSPSLDTIEVNCTANDPIMAREFIIALRDGYIQRSREHINKVLTSTRDFFKAEIVRYQNQINEAERAIQAQFEDFKGVTPGSVDAAAARLNSIEAECTRLSQRYSDLNAQITVREDFLASQAMCEPSQYVVQAEAGSNTSDAKAPPLLPNTTSTIDAAIKQVEKQIADAILMERMTNEHPHVKGLRRKLDNLTAARESTRSAADLAPSDPAAQPASIEQTAAQRSIVRDPVLAGHRMRIELELEALRAQAQNIKTHLNDTTSRRDEFAALYTRMLNEGDQTRKLEDQIEENRNSLTVWRQHYTQLERILAAENEDRGTIFSLIEEPKENPHAIKPQAAAVFVVCSGCGLAAAALLIALAELTDRSFRTTSQVTRSLGLPILECITVIRTPKIKRKQMLSRLIWTPALCLLVCSLIASASLAYVSLEHPNLHHRAISKLNNALETVGAPSMSLENKAK